jgi:hypothetical protein
MSQASEWTSSDSVRQRIVLTTFYADYLQTKDIKNHPGMYERNPILGAHPSNRRIGGYFVLAAASHSYIAYRMNPEMRRNFQYATIALQVAVILHNKRIGLNYEF